MSEEEQKYFKGLIGFTFDSDDIRYIEKIVDKKDKEIERQKEVINGMIENEEKNCLEINRLNNKLKDIKSQLDYLETYSSKEDVFEDMKRRLDRIDKIIGSDKE